MPGRDPKKISTPGLLGGVLGILGGLVQMVVKAMPSADPEVRREKALARLAERDLVLREKAVDNWTRWMIEYVDTADKPIRHKKAARKLVAARATLKSLGIDVIELEKDLISMGVLGA